MSRFDDLLNTEFEKWKKSPEPVTQMELARRLKTHRPAIARIEKRAFKKLRGMIDPSWLY